MSKNLTRKGLALGAVVALGSSLFAGTPASAAPGITLTDLNDKGNYTMLEGEKFTFLASGNSDWTGAASTLRVKVKNVSGSATVPVELVAGSAASAVNYATSGASDTAIGTVAGDTAVFAASTSPFQFSLTSGAIAADVTETYEVTVWADVNNNGVVNDGEYASPARTLVFKDIAALTTTIAIDAAVEGATTVGADVSIPGFAIDQLTAAEFGVKFTNGTGGAIASSANVDAVTLSTDKTKFEADLAVDALVKDTAVKAQLKWKDSAVATNDSGNSAVGAAVTAAVVAKKATTITADVVRSTTGKYVSAGNADVLLNSEFELKATVKDGATTPKAVAGLPVEVAITVPTGTLSGTAGSVVSVTVNGTVYTDEAKLPGASSTYAKIKTTTDADGVAKVKISSAGLVATDVVTAVFSTETLSSTVAATQRAASYTAYIMNSVYGSTSGVSTTDGTAAKVSIEVHDQFGGVPADSYDAVATWTSNGQATTASTVAASTYSAIVGGKATLSILDNGTGVGVNVYTISWAKRATNGARTDSVDIKTGYRVAIVEAADLVAGKITSTGTLNADTKIYENTSGVALSLNDTANYDVRTATGTAPTVGTQQTLTGVVSVASSATQAATPIEGAALTITGPAGTQFQDASNSVYGAGSLTVYTNSSGEYTIKVSSNKAGTQTFTLTSGSATQKVSIKFNAAAATTGTNLVVDAPAYILPGRTLTVTATLTDKYGNPVAVTADDVDVAYAGPGLLVGTMVDAFDTDGKATFRVLLGAYDSGSATVTVKYDQSSDNDFTGTETGDLDLVKTATITLGAAPAAGATAAIAGSTKRFFVSVDGNSSARNVVVKVAGKTFKTLKGSTAKKTYLVAAPKGSHKVTVFVGGKLIATKTVSVK